MNFAFADDSVETLAVTDVSFVSVFVLMKSFSSLSSLASVSDGATFIRPLGSRYFAPFCAIVRHFAE